MLDLSYDSASAAVADIPESEPPLRVDSHSLPTPNAQIQTVLQAGDGRVEGGLEQSRTDHHRLVLLLRAGRLSTMLASHVGENKEFACRHLCGQLEFEPTAQGTRAEKLRAGGHCGVQHAHRRRHPSGRRRTAQRYGPDEETTQDSKPTEWSDFPPDGNQGTFVLEECIDTDCALIHAAYGDPCGDVVFNLAATLLGGRDGREGLHHPSRVTGGTLRA
jgi:3-oxoacid CoA-transferase subunit A